MEARLEQLFKSTADYEVLQRYKGRQLENVKYAPIFDYFAEVI